MQTLAKGLEVHIPPSVAPTTGPENWPGHRPEGWEMSYFAGRQAGPRELQEACHQSTRFPGPVL